MKLNIQRKKDIIVNQKLYIRNAGGKTVETLFWKHGNHGNEIFSAECE